MTKVREHEVLQALAAKHHGKDAFFTHVKNGATHMARTGELAIIDAIAVAKSWAHPIIRGYEVKVERSDFLRDEKWHKYFDMCHMLSFVCPAGIIHPEELPENVGLIYYNSEKKSLHTKKKAVYREIQMPVDMLWYIIICQLDSDRYPFFSGQRDYFEAWVADKKDKKNLGGHRVSEKLRRISEKVPELERELKREHEKAEDRDELLRLAGEVLEPYGVKISKYQWGWQKKLQEVLAVGGAPNLSRAFELAKSLEQELSQVYEATQRTEG